MDIETATISDGSLMHDGRKLEPSSAPATNQYGYIEYPTWQEAADNGAVIFVSDYGQPHVDAHRKPA